MAHASRLIWAKWRRGSAGEADSLHPLLNHMIDASSVCEALLAEGLSASSRRRFAEALGLPVDDASRWVAFVVGLHDLGKANPAFQSQNPAVREELEAQGLPFARPGDRATPHGTIAVRLLPTLLHGDLGLARELSRQIGLLLGGHHGVIPKDRDVKNTPEWDLGGREWEEVRGELASELAGVLGIPRRPSPTAENLRSDVAATIAGLTIVADWIASNEVFFPHERASADPSQYLGRARERARDALERLLWGPWRPARGGSFHGLFGFGARPVQESVVRLADSIREPSLVLIEAPMGEGKTEAALYLAQALVAEQSLRGFYVALPTQATSNQMFDRVRDFLERGPGGGPVALQLLHGRASLSEALRELLERGRSLPAPSFVDGSPAADPAGTVAAQDWFTFRKRGLLAPLGVGTIDQALLAALKARHVAVRLFGLADKVVIVDEVAESGRWGTGDWA